MAPNALQPQQASTTVIWQALPSTCRLKQWSHDLRQVSTGPFNAEAWTMAGHAVLIEAEDAELVRDMLHCVAGESGMALHRVSPSDMGENFAEWLAALPATEATMVYLEPGAWQSEANEAPHSENAQSDAQREHLREYLLDQAIARPVVFVSTATSFGKLATALRHAGLFDRRICFSNLTPELHAQRFLADMQGQALALSMTQDVRKLGALLHYEYPDQRRRGLMQQALCRLAWREQRALEFADLVRFAAYGTCEVDPQVGRHAAIRRHAIHEAGHALITHVDSKNKTPPTYCSVLTHRDSHGIVVSPFDGHERTSDDLSYADMCHKVRVYLGGRAAEHLLLGAAQVSAEGAASDLEQATRLACSMMGAWGLPIDLSSDDTASANLAIVVDEISASEAKHVESMTRRFLQAQFIQTLGILKTHRRYLDVIVEMLVEKQVLLQEDFIRLYAVTERVIPAP